jgi:hypothetical protein
VSAQKAETRSETREVAAERRRRAGTACLLGWLFPGGGHLYLGRRGRGALCGGAILLLFVMGVAMQARLEIHFGLDDPLAFLLSLAQVATGVPYLIARGLGYALGDVRAATFEYGNTFAAVSGLLNALVALDAYDIGVGRKA